MRFLLDTNVLSEPVKTRPDTSVIGWLDDTSPLDLGLSVLSLGEVASGLARLPRGGKRAALEAWLGEDLPRRFEGRLLPIDSEVSMVWGALSASAASSGRPLPVIDGLLLATASVHGLTFVTRNEKDCAGRGVPILNPWTA